MQRKSNTSEILKEHTEATQNRLDHIRTHYNEQLYSKSFIIRSSLIGRMNRVIQPISLTVQ